MARHLFIAVWQTQWYNMGRQNLAEGEVILTEDFSEDYRTELQCMP